MQSLRLTYHQLSQFRYGLSSPLLNVCFARHSASEIRYIHSLINQRDIALLNVKPLLISQYAFFNKSPISNNNNGKKDDKKKKNIPPWAKWFHDRGWTKWITVISWALAGLVFYDFLKSRMADGQTNTTHNKTGAGNGGNDTPYISWKEFENDLVRAGEVEKLSLMFDSVYVYLKPGAYFRDHQLSPMQNFFPACIMKVENPQKFEQKLRDLENELGIPLDEQIPFRFTQPSRLLQFFFLVGLTLALVALVRYGMSKVGGLKINTDDLLGGKRHFKVAKKGLGMTFKDIAGLHEAKIEIMEFVDYLKNPTRYKQLGAHIPRGALLTGPPGCGKTALAKAVSSEAEVPFLSVSASEFVEMFGGVGAKRVRSLFKDARRSAPCIIYIDEIDAIGRKRSTTATDFGSQEEEQTLNQLLSEMDGMGSLEGVIVLAATNRSDLLDNALLRPGRFDRHILIDYPTLAERRELFDMYIKKLKMSDLVEDLEALIKNFAHLSPGMSGADVANVCNEAAIHAASNKKTSVEESDLDFAIEKVLAGSAKRTNVMSPQEKRIVAFREAGHALAAWSLEHAKPPLKISLIPRTSGKFSFFQAPKEFGLTTQEEMDDQMCVLMGGRVSEAMIFNHTSSASEDQLKKITELARMQVEYYGMSPVIGTLSFNKPGDLEQRPYSKHLHALIDQEISRIVTRTYDRTFQLLDQNRESLRTVADSLLQHETVPFTGLVHLLGPPASDKKKDI